jgi:hypothetical protein
MGADRQRPHTPPLCTVKAALLTRSQDFLSSEPLQFFFCPAFRACTLYVSYRLRASPSAYLIHHGNTELFVNSLSETPLLHVTLSNILFISLRSLKTRPFQIDLTPDERDDRLIHTDPPARAYLSHPVTCIHLKRQNPAQGGTVDKVDSIPFNPWEFLRPTPQMEASAATLSIPSGTQTGSQSRAPSVRRREQTSDSEKAGRVWARGVDDPWDPCILTLDGGNA